MPTATASSARTRTFRWASDLGAVRFTEGADSFHRSWVMLLPEGSFEHPKGTLDLSRRSLAEMKRNFDAGVRGVEIALDYDHQASEGDSRAPGWIERVDLCERGRSPDGAAVDADAPAGLWGLIRWTRIGLADVQDQIFRYISAEYRPEWTNPVSGRTYKNVLVGATLTNRPFMNHMPAIRLKAKEAGTVAGKRSTSGGKLTAKVEEPEDLDEQEFEDEDTELAEDEEDGSEEYDDGAGDDDAEDEADGGDDEDEEDDSARAQPTPPKRKAGRSAGKAAAGKKKTAAAKGAVQAGSGGRSKQMSERMSERGDGENEEGAIALREQFEAQAVRLKEAEKKLREAEIGETLRGWENDSKLMVSRAVREHYRAVMLDERVRGDEKLGEQITNLVAAAFKGAVDLSQKSASFDMESRRDRKPGERGSDHDVVELAEKFAQSEHGKSIDALTESKEQKERDAARKIINRAAAEVGFRLVGN